MNAAERLADALKQGGKIEGFRENIYREDGSVHSSAIHWIEIDAGDVLEVTKACGGKDHPSQIVKDLHKGVSNPLNCGRKVTIKADDLFHLLKQQHGMPLMNPD
jgi:hypothetical protein